MTIAKGMMILGSVVAGGAALAAASVSTISAPLWGMMGATYTVNGVAAAGAVAASSCGLNRIQIFRLTKKTG